MSKSIWSKQPNTGIEEQSPKDQPELGIEEKIAYVQLKAGIEEQSPEDFLTQLFLQLEVGVEAQIPYAQPKTPEHQSQMEVVDKTPQKLILVRLCYMMCMVQINQSIVVRGTQIMKFQIQVAKTMSQIQ